MIKKKFKGSEIDLDLQDNKLKIRETEILKIKKPNLLGMGKLELLKLKK